MFRSFESIRIHADQIRIIREAEFESMDPWPTHLDASGTLFLTVPSFVLVSEQSTAVVLSNVDLHFCINGLT